MESDLPEEFKCPICFEIPTNEIFQCQNGHTICSDCSKTLLECPQCRIPYGKNKIRNRALESLLDTMKFDCPHKSLGCTSTLNRKTYLDHSESCSFLIDGEAKISFCDKLGYSCGFLINLKNIDEALDHLENSHNFIICRDKENLQIQLEGFLNFNQNEKSIWTPIVLKPERNKQAAYILLSIFNEIDLTVAVTCLELNGNQNQENVNDFCAKFCIHSMNQTRNIEWITILFNIDEAEFAIQNPYFRFPADMLTTNFLVDGAVQINFSLLKAGKPFITNIPRKNVEVIYTFNSSFNASNESIVGSESEEEVPSAPPLSPPPPPVESQNERPPPLPLTPPPVKLGSTQKRPTPLPVTMELPNQRPLPPPIPKKPPTLNQDQKPLVPIKPEVVKEEEQVIFHGVFCQSCAEVPLKKTFYKCLQCTDFNYCSGCMLKGDHGHHIFALMRNAKQVSRLESRTKFPNGLNSLFPEVMVAIGEMPEWCAENATKCSKCDLDTSYTCLQCRPTRGYCKTCYEKRRSKHVSDHSFAVTKTIRQLLRLLKNMPECF